ncbi:MAG: LacI family transcriptional regulator [Propionibacteriaceae bacterium]|nr:LacI family transcriptional regulator [Propionibacteriaceae bacterium]
MTDAPKSPRVRIGDVAAAAGVSKALVSYALNGRPGVGEETRAHIIEVATSLGWTPSVRARSLSGSKAYAIGLVFQHAAEHLGADEYLSSLMAGIHAALLDTGYALVTSVVPDLDAEVAAYTRLAAEGRVDGFVIVDPSPDEPIVGLVADRGLAYACLGRPGRVTRMPVLEHDEAPAVAEVAAHLAGLGHRRVAQVAGPQRVPSAKRRRQQFQDAFRAQGLDADRWIAQEYSAVGGRAATAQLLDDTDPPTAIVFSDDLMAIAGMGVAGARGLRIPEDLSVVGWNGITVAEYLHPALSTVTQYPYEDGRLAATLLLEAIGGREFSDIVATPNPRFVARDSTGPARR